MSYNKIERNSIDRYLYELAKEYKKRNKSADKNNEAEIIVVGGAAILLRYSFRFSSLDVDAYVKATSSFKDAVNAVGDKFALSYRWLNSDFLKTESYTPKIVEYSKYYKKFCNILSVRTIEGEYLVAMKLVSSRLYKRDLSDIVGILKEHEEFGDPITFERIDSAMKKLYGGWEKVSDENKYYIQNVLQSEDLEKLYYDIVNEEKINSDYLKDADKKYPGKMNSKNAEDFLKSIKKKSGQDKPSVLEVLRSNQEKVSKETEIIQKENLISVRDRKVDINK